MDVDDILDKLERGQHPTKSEIRAAKLCAVCEGFGETYDDEGEPTKCRACGGDGLAPNHPMKGK